MGDIPSAKAEYPQQQEQQQQQLAEMGIFNDLLIFQSGCSLSLSSFWKYRHKFFALRTLSRIKNNTNKV